MLMHFRKLVSASLVGEDTLEATNFIKVDYQS